MSNLVGFLLKMLILFGAISCFEKQTRMRTTNNLCFFYKRLLVLCAKTGFKKFLPLVRCSNISFEIFLPLVLCAYLCFEKFLLLVRCNNLCFEKFLPPVRCNTSCFIKLLPLVRLLLFYFINKTKMVFAGNWFLFFQRTVETKNNC